MEGDSTGSGLHSKATWSGVVRMPSGGGMSKLSSA